MFFLYQIIISIIILLSPLIILIRILKNKEDIKRFKEKFCLFSKKKVTGKLIWFHGASVGELLSLIPIIYKLEKTPPLNKFWLQQIHLVHQRFLKNIDLKKQFINSSQLIIHF